jgi:hypothetical protein
MAVEALRSACLATSRIVGYVGPKAAAQDGSSSML